MEKIFDYTWGEGRLPNDHDAWATLMQELGVSDSNEHVFSDAVKTQLKTNTDEAIKRGVFGVPTSAVDKMLFWGLDSTGMVLDYLQDPAPFNDAEMKRIDELPVAASRK